MCFHKTQAIKVRTCVSKLWTLERPQVGGVRTLCQTPLVRRSCVRSMPVRRGVMSRQWAHWHGLELQITSAAQLKFIGVAKKTRTCRVVATIYHSHCRGSPEALLLRIKGVKLLPDYNQPRDGASFAGFQARRTAFEAHEDSDHDVVLPIGHPRDLAALGFHEPQLANGDLTNERGYVQRTYRRGADSRLVNILVDIGQCFRINQNGADHLFYYCTPTHPEEAARFGFPPAEWCDHELADHIEPVQSGDRGLSLGDSESSDDEVAPAPVAAALAASSGAEPSGEPDSVPHLPVSI